MHKESLVIKMRTWKQLSRFKLKGGRKYRTYDLILLSCDHVILSLSVGLLPIRATQPPTEFPIIINTWNLFKLLALGLFKECSPDHNKNVLIYFVAFAIDWRLLQDSFLLPAQTLSE